MYARDLMVWLHERLAQQEEIEKTLQRFERLRGNALLPRGRENAGLRLSDEQIANAVLAFAHDDRTRSCGDARAAKPEHGATSTKPYLQVPPLRRSRQEPFPAPPTGGSVRVHATQSCKPEH
jgi:hypothetical protein